MSSVRIDLRTEDVLTAVFTAALLVFVGVRTPLAAAILDEARFWDLSFVLLPMALLVFAQSVRFAFGGSSSRLARAAGVLRDWLPFLLFSLTYEAFQVGLWGAILVRDRDAELLRLDRSLFGESPAFVLQRVVTPWLSDLLSFFYFLHVVLPPLLGLALWLRDRRAFREFLLAVLLCGMLGSAGYLSVPATGPATAFRDVFHVTLGGTLYQPFNEILDAARAPRDAFPSLHAAISAVVLCYSWRLGRTAGLVAVPVVVLIWFSTLYLRYHYAVDLVAGGLLAAAAVAISRLLLRLEDRLRKPPDPRVSAGG